jgi:hypothetical protein
MKKIETKSLVLLKHHLKACERRSKSAARGGPKVQRPMCYSPYRLGFTGGLTLPPGIRPGRVVKAPAQAGGAWRP